MEIKDVGPELVLARELRADTRSAPTNCEKKYTAPRDDKARVRSTPNTAGIIAAWLNGSGSIKRKP